MYASTEGVPTVGATYGWCSSGEEAAAYSGAGSLYDKGSAMFDTCDDACREENGLGPDDTYDDAIFYDNGDPVTLQDTAVTIACMVDEEAGASTLLATSAAILAVAML